MGLVYSKIQEKEADDARRKFAQSTDVVGDMSRAYGNDFSKVNIHHDKNADNIASSYGHDAVAGKNDIYFSESSYDMSDVKSRGLLAHELHHTTQTQAGTDAVQGGDIELSQDEVNNSRFYGATFARMGQMMGLHVDVEGKTGSSNVMKQSVDNLNKRIGIDGNAFKRGTLEPIRRMVFQAVFENAPASQDLEAKEWGQWLKEPSRMGALFMPELNSEICRRDRKLDKEDKQPASEKETIPSTEQEENVEKIDNEKKRIYIGDAKRMDDLSHWINSGQKRTVGEEEYDIYWGQEGYGVDSGNEVEDNYHTWTPELKTIHQKILNKEAYSTGEGYEDFKRAARKKYWNKKDEKAQAFTDKVKQETGLWVQISVQNRFFRLTSLMGLDFFKQRGNTVQFARDNDQKNFTEGRVNRVITDSEWAHANRMGYVGENVHQVGNQDRFKLRQTN